MMRNLVRSLERCRTVAECRRHRNFAAAATSHVGENRKVDYGNSVDDEEISKFRAMADSWWDPYGPYRPLHAMNPVRVSFIRSALCQHFGKDGNTAKPLEGLAVIDVGCGGGLTCEPIARMGGSVLGIDALEENLQVASVHAVRISAASQSRDAVTSSIEYRCVTAEQLVVEDRKFDAVLALEVIEHVADPMEFCQSLAALAKTDGMVIISTLNRSIPAYGLAIVGAEYILGLLPKGTHDWSKFLTPEELALIMKRASLSMEELAGLVYNPISRTWSLSNNTSVNYIASSVKREESRTGDGDG